MQGSTSESKKSQHNSEQSHTKDRDVLTEIMKALKPHVEKDKNRFKVVAVDKGRTVGGELTLQCKYRNSDDVYFVYANSKFNAPTALELARFLRKNDIEPELKAIAAKAINRLLGELGIAAPRLTVEAPRLADQAPSDGALHHTLPPALSARCTSSRLLADGKRRTRSSASTDNTSSSKWPKVDSDAKGGGAEEGTAAGAAGHKRKAQTEDTAPGTSLPPAPPLFRRSILPAIKYF
jgi:hypothetical protein